MDYFTLENFFVELPKEPISTLFEEGYPWEALKALKDYLYQTLPLLPRSFPVDHPLSENLFLTSEGEVLSLRELEEDGGQFYYRGSLVVGAIIKAGAFISGRRFHFGPLAVVEPFAYLKEPVYVGEGVEVRHGAYVRGNVYLSSFAVVGHTTEIKNSIFFPKAKAAHFAYVGDSILGRHVNLGAGTKLANLRFLRKEIVVEIEGKLLKTGLKKFGAILGDEVQTGCNAVLQPGTLVGRKAIIYPGVTAGPGFIPVGKKIK